jgi:aryl-alcohol dehydrogenase-like predicted oxidoreductase
VIGIGTNRWVAGGSADETARLKNTLRTFQQMGGRVIDTAPSYRTSEKVLGQLIAELNFDEAFFLATKVDREEKRAGIERMQDSLTKLNRASMDLMQVHNLRGAHAQLENMIEWRKSGRIRYVGITTSRNDQHAEMEALMNELPVDFIQVNYSLAEREAESRILPLAQEKGIAVLANLPLARGRLFKATADKTLPGWAAEFDCSSWGQFFLKYVVSHTAVTCAIPGMTRVAHAEDNMGANFGRLPDADLRMRQEKLIADL